DLCVFVVNFFFQAEDGIRDFHVTGVQTCALPIFPGVTDAAEAFRDNLQVPQLDTVTAPMDRDLPTTEFGMLPGVEEVVGAFQGAGVPNLPHTGSVGGNLPLGDVLAAPPHAGALPMAPDDTEL